MKSVFLLGMVSFILSGCSMFQSSPNTSASAPKQKFVNPQARTTEGLRKRILVLPFLDADVQRSDKVANNVRQAYLRMITASDNFVLIDPNDLPKSADTFKQNEEYDMEAVAKLAANLGVLAVVEGKVMEVSAKRVGDQVGVFRKVRARMNASIRVRAFATKNAKEVMNEMRSATVEDEITVSFGGENYKLEEDPKLIQETITKAFKGTTVQLARTMEKLSWEGRIAMINGDRIFLNSGRMSGLQVGDILRVTEEGADIFDPDSGVFIGRAPGRTKGTIEVVSYFGKDGAIAIIHSGAGFKENDKIELY